MFGFRSDVLKTRELTHRKKLRGLDLGKQNDTQEKTLGVGQTKSSRTSGLIKRYAFLEQEARMINRVPVTISNQLLPRR